MGWLEKRAAPKTVMRAAGGTGGAFTYLTQDEGARKVYDRGRILLDEDVIPFLASKNTMHESIAPRLEPASGQTFVPETELAASSTLAQPE